MKLKTVRIISMILILMIMVTIFVFSAQEADESNESSGHIVEWILKLLFPRLTSYPTEKQDTIRDTATLLVRKTAHFSEYAILAGSFLIFFRTFPKIRQGLWAWAATAAYASTDEFHQLFVPGRAGRITDVMIDSAGAAAGILLMLLFLRTDAGKHGKKPE